MYVHVSDRAVVLLTSTLVRSRPDSQIAMKGLSVKLYQLEQTERYWVARTNKEYTWEGGPAGDSV
jgi:hypothetical protein